MLLNICPKCATGTCEYRDGIKCRAWICAKGRVPGGGRTGPSAGDESKTGGRSLNGSNIEDFLRNFVRGFPS